MKFLRSFSIVIFASLLSGCAGLLVSDLPTPLPTEFLPTVIALTLQAGEAEHSPALTSAAVVPEPGTPQPESVVDTPLPQLSATPSIEPPTATPYPITLPPPPTETPLPEIPAASVQIFNPGDLSRVVSPLHISSYLKAKSASLIRIELFGEDGRLLVRQDKKFVSSLSWSNLSLDLDFEISATAEVGRLVISVDDEYGRTMALNSVDLILMSVGEADINPSSAVDETIIIQQPVVKSLIQGGQVLVSGIARPDTSRPLMAELRDAKNKIVGFRQLGVSDLAKDGYGTFAVEVPYKVDALTPVRLSVFEDGENVSAMTHLSSIEVMLGP
jgi:hypothetical protein